MEKPELKDYNLYDKMIKLARKKIIIIYIIYEFIVIFIPIYTIYILSKDTYVQYLTKNYILFFAVIYLVIWFYFIKIICNPKYIISKIPICRNILKKYEEFKSDLNYYSYLPKSDNEMEKPELKDYNLDEKTIKVAKKKIINRKIKYLFIFINIIIYIIYRFFEDIDIHYDFIGLIRTFFIFICVIIIVSFLLYTIYIMIDKLSEQSIKYNKILEIYEKYKSDLNSYLYLKKNNNNIIPD